MIAFDLHARFGSILVSIFDEIRNLSFFFIFKTFRTKIFNYDLYGFMKHRFAEHS